MTRSTAKLKLGAHYKYMNFKEIRHRAGLAWAKGELKLHEALEALAMTKQKRGIGEHGCWLGGGARRSMPVIHAIVESHSKKRYQLD